MANCYLFCSCNTFSSDLSDNMGCWAIFMEYTWCLVGKAYWVYDVRLISLTLFHLLSDSYILHILICSFWGVLLQSSVLEISLCNLFLGYTTTSTSCCLNWYIWEETSSEYMARFILGSFAINYWTFRFVSSLFGPLVYFSHFFDCYVCVYTTYQL